MGLMGERVMWSEKRLNTFSWALSPRKRCSPSGARTG